MTADTESDSGRCGDNAKSGTRPRQTVPPQPPADSTIAAKEPQCIGAPDGEAVDEAANKNLATDVDPPPELRGQILAAARRARPPRPNHPDRKPKT